MLHTLSALAMTWTLTWTKSTYELQRTMISIGWNKENSKEIINQCKKSALDPRKCVKFASAIWANETQACKTAYQNSCFWVTKSYLTQKESIRDWVKKYNKYWYKAIDASHFYWYKGKSPKTHYCMSEKSSWSVGWCKNGFKNTTYFLAKFR